VRKALRWIDAAPGACRLIALARGVVVLAGWGPAADAPPVPASGGVTICLPLLDLRAFDCTLLWASHLGGAIPPELGGLSRLQVLDLIGKQRGGAIPPELGGLSKLQVLDLYGDQLGGAIPP